MPTVVSGFLLPVLAGNAPGGVVLVALLNYGQTEEAFPEAMRKSPPLPWREWLLRDRTTDPRATEEE